MYDLEPIFDRLTGAGAPFELACEAVHGIPMRVFARRPASLRALLEASASHDERAFLVSGPRRIAYREHRAAVAAFARVLAERHGIGPGDRVAILGANSPDWIVAFFAATSLGAIAVGLNGWWAGEEIRHALADSEPKLLLADRKRRERVGDACAAIAVEPLESAFTTLAFDATDEPALPAAAIDEDDPACILYTSGTTGRAKGAILSHRSLIAGATLQALHGAAAAIASAEAMPGGAVAAPAQPCALLTTPLFHVSGLVAGVLVMLAAGAKVVLRDGRFDPVDVLRIVERERVTAWAATPTMAHRVVSHPAFADFDLSSLRSFGAGGSALSPSLQERIRKQLPQAGIGLGYGLTESGGVATALSGEALRRSPGSAGHPMPGVEVEIRDEAGRALGEGAEGQICVRSPLVMLGYWRNAAATRAVLAPDRWLATGDIGRIEGGLLFINARARDLILRGGENVHPIEVEQALEAHPDVDEAAVVGADHEDLGQEVHAFVVARGGIALDPATLAGWVGDRLAAFKVPSRWTFRSAPLPRNPSGKLLKAELLGAPSRFVGE